MLLPITFHSHTGEEAELFLELHLSRTQGGPAGNDATEGHQKTPCQVSQVCGARGEAKADSTARSQLCFAEQLLRNREPRTVKHFVDVIHASHMLAPLQEHSTVFFCSHCDAVIFVGSLRLLKSQCDGSGGSRGKARRLLSGCLRDRRRETLERTLNSAEADALNASSSNEEQPCMRRTLRGTERDADGVGIW